MKKLNNRSIAAVAVFLAVLIGGALPVYVKIGLKETSPEVFSFLRFIISSFILLPFFLNQRVKINKDLLKLTIVSLFGTGNILFFAYGVRLTQASIAQSVYVLSPVVVVILSYFLIREKMNYKKLLGILIGFIGAILIILLPVIEKSSPFSGNLAGNLLVVIALLSFSLYSVLSKKFQPKFSPMQITMVFSLTTAFVMLILSLPQLDHVAGKISAFSSQTVFAILYVATLGTAGYHLLYQYAIKHGSPTVASTILYLQPASTIIWAFVLLGERLTTGFILGAILAVAGTSLIIKSK